MRRSFLNRAVRHLSLFAVSGMVVSGVLAQSTPNYVGVTTLLHGQVTDTEGLPLANLAVEIWHTDLNGNYNHPNDTPADQLLADFQYFGTAQTDENGNYVFLTLKPIPYDGRPTHIHFKVKQDGETLLTSQFYFLEDEAEVAQDGVYGDAGAMLFLQNATEDVDADIAEDGIRSVIGNIVLDLNGDGADVMLATPAQTEGPYYPVVDFSAYDNNLTNGVTDEEAYDLPSASVEFTLFNLNTGTADEFLTIPNMSNRMVREFEEYRPYVSIVQFRREIGKYVNADQVAAYEQFVYVPISVNDADAETLKQIPNVTDEVANALIANRPYASNAAFLEALASYLDAESVALAGYYLVGE